MTRQIKVVSGLQRIKKPLYPSEAGYVASMQAQCRELEQALQNVFDQIEDISEDVMLDALQPTLELAKYYTPYKTGELRNSGYLEGTSSVSHPRVEIGFGFGGNPRYTVFVHEMVQVPHVAPTQAKFLQKAVLEDLPNIYDRLVAGYQEAFRG